MAPDVPREPTITERFEKMNINLTVKWKSDCETNWNCENICVEDNESSFYKGIAEKLLVVDFPGELRAESNLGDVVYSVKQRGTYWRDSEKVPSMYVTKKFDSVYGLSPSSYSPVYLTCVSPGADSHGYGNYKFYKMVVADNEIKVDYGRIGADEHEMFGKRSTTYSDTTLYWIRYYEKLSKLYKDQSDVFFSPVHSKVKKDAGNENENSVRYELFSKLARYANKALENTLENADVTEGMIAESRNIYNRLCEQDNVNSFNEVLLELVAVSPRKVRSLNSLLAKSKLDFPVIIDREESLILAMEGSVSHNTKESETDKIEVYIATDEQREKVLGMLDDNLKSKVKTVYRVINPEHKKRFNSYLKRHHIKKVKELWHGSRNQNWYSIIKNGLQLYPNAVITGKMFGNGIYFAPKAHKSWGYTSYHGTYWARGNESTAFMGLYCTAYGTPMDCYGIQRFTQQILLDSNRNCVHAHAGQYLCNDEIVFYSESAILLNYIVEFQ